MINSLKNFFSQDSDKQSKPSNDLYILVGLMVEAANIDGIVDNQEIDKIKEALINIFNEDPQSVETEIHKCLNELNDHKSLHFFTSKINKSFSNEKKIILMEILWEIILQDGKVHDFESNLIRRLGGLLYISDFECGKVKKKVLNKINIEKNHKINR